MASTATGNPEFGVHTVSVGLIDEEASYHSFRRGDARVIFPNAATWGIIVALAFSVRRKKVPPSFEERVYGVRLSIRVKLVPPCFHVPVISELSLLMVPS